MVMKQWAKGKVNIIITKLFIFRLLGYWTFCYVDCRCPLLHTYKLLRIRVADFPGFKIALEFFTIEKRGCPTKLRLHKNDLFYVNQTFWNIKIKSQSDSFHSVPNANFHNFEIGNIRFSFSYLYLVTLLLILLRDF